MNQIPASKAVILLWLLMVSTLLIGCGGSPDFKSFDDIDVPKQYMEYRQETLENQRVSADTAAQDSSSTERPARSSRSSKRALPLPSSSQEHSSAAFKAARQKIFTFNKASSSVQEGYQKAMSMINQGNRDSGLERLKHVASLAYEEPEACSQIYFTIYNLLEEQGNMREAGFYFDKFQENLKKIQDEKGVGDSLKQSQRAVGTLDRLFPQKEESQED